MARKNSNHDYADADKRKKNNTSQALPRNDGAKNKLLEQWRKRHVALQKDQKDQKGREQTEEPSQELTQGQKQKQSLTKMPTIEPTQEHTQETTKKENNPDEHNEDKYVKKWKQTCIMKLIKENPEMPKILELDDLQRKQLAELMLEYPTKEEQLEGKNNQGEQTGEKRIFTCLNCKRTYDTIGGKLNHLRYNEKCRKAPQRETFENKCQECGRQFTSPCRLKEHHKYICTQQETDGEEEEERENEKDNYENQNMPICDEETKAKGKNPKTSTGEAENEETDSEQKRNNTKRTDVLGGKEDKKADRNRGNKKMDT